MKPAMFNEAISSPVLNVSLLTLSTLITLAILAGSLNSKMRQRPFMRAFTALLVLHALMQVGEIGIWLLNGAAGQVVLLKLSCVLSFGSGSLLVGLMAYCLLFFLREQHPISLAPAHVLLGAGICCTLLSVCSTWSGIFFQVNSAGLYQDGPWIGLVYAFDVLTLLGLISLFVFHHRYAHTSGYVVILSWCLVDLMSMLLVDIWYPTPAYLATTIAAVLIYTYFYDELSRTLVQRERELAQSRMNLLISQIQPHFLYNCLNSIHCLCSKDVQLAQTAIDDFSTYLRDILSASSQTVPIAFSQELRYVQDYLRLEKLRFDDELQIDYQIDVTDFTLPALSIQPLVENAVKHGLCQKEGGGTLTIRTSQLPTCYEILIIDDGVGFDPQALPRDGRPHLGIENVTRRLESMCRGSLTITSRPNQGTTVRICLPRPTQDR